MKENEPIEIIEFPLLLQPETTRRLEGVSERARITNMEFIDKALRFGYQVVLINDNTSKSYYYIRLNDFRQKEIPITLSSYGYNEMEENNIQEEREKQSPINLNLHGDYYKKIQEFSSSYGIAEDLLISRFIEKGIQFAEWEQLRAIQIYSKISNFGEIKKYKVSLLNY